MTIFEKINALPILDVMTAFGVSSKKDSGSLHMYTVLKSDGSPDESFKINTNLNIAVNRGGGGEKGGPFDIIARMLQFDSQTTEGRHAVVELFKEKGLVQDDGEKKEFVKSLTGKELFENFSDYTLGGFKSEVSKFLITRGVPYEFIQKNANRIGEVFKDIGYYESFFCTEHPTWKDEDGKFCHEEGDLPKPVPVVIFPSYDGTIEKNIIGIKLRRVDGKTIWGKKSYCPAGLKTGIFYNNIDKDVAILTEGETDGIILEILGFRSVMWNMGGVQSCRAMIKSRLFDSTKIICLYDNDMAGLDGKRKLSEQMGRNIFTIDFPLREDKNGVPLHDINDFYRAGYDTKQKWADLLAKAYSVKVIGDEQEEIYRFIYLDDPLYYFDTQTNNIVDKGKIMEHEMLSSSLVQDLRRTKKIRQFQDTCYLHGGRKNHYNIMRIENMVLDGGEEEPRISEGIELLVSNFCGKKEMNIEWMHKAILYKITHINDVKIPAVISFGVGGSGKGSIIRLLGEIFGSENVQQGLGQKDLTSNYDSYTGKKIILEFKEISSGNTQSDKIVLDRLKGIVFEPRIHVNPKYEPAREVDNIAWVHLSSNHKVPLQLDSQGTGNRRWTIIKTGGPLSDEEAKLIHRSIGTKKDIQAYVAWLFDKYPEVPKMRSFHALDNHEKRDLENYCEGVGNQFFAWFERKHPNIWKITAKQKEILLQEYISDNQLADDIHKDKRYDNKNFNMSLTHKYEYKTVKINGKSFRGYLIIKTPSQKEYIPRECPGYFSDEEWNTLLGKMNVTF